MLNSDRETLASLSTEGAEIARSHGLANISKPVADEAESKLADNSLPLRFARGSIGKLLSYHLLD